MVLPQVSTVLTNRQVFNRKCGEFPDLLRNSRKTEGGAKQFLTRSAAVRAAPFAVLRNSRKTECGAKPFLTRSVAVRAAPLRS
jgi:hypothetical protein